MDSFLLTQLMAEKTLAHQWRPKQLFDFILPPKNRCSESERVPVCFQTGGRGSGFSGSVGEETTGTSARW